MLCTLISSAVAIVLASCGREAQIKGDIFIVTKGHQSVKLGLVQIAAIPAGEVRRIVSERRAKIARSQKRLNEIHAEYEKLGVSDSTHYLDVSGKLTPHDYDRFMELFQSVNSLWRHTTCHLQTCRRQRALQSPTQMVVSGWCCRPVTTCSLRKASAKSSTKLKSITGASQRARRRTPTKLSL